MKKFKKILSAVSAALLCALPMANGIVSNAADEAESLNTYKLYFDVSKNSGISSASFVMDYHNIQIQESTIGNLGGSIDEGKIKTPDYYEYGVVYISSKILMNPGTLFTSKVTTNYDFDSCIVNIRTDAFDNASKVMSVNPITIDVVLMGDVNGDGIVDIRDVVLVNKYIGNKQSVSINLRAADVNEDGVITEDDSMMMQQYLAAVIKHF